MWAPWLFRAPSGAVRYRTAAVLAWHIFAPWRIRVGVWARRGRYYLDSRGTDAKDAEQVLANFDSAIRTLLKV